MSETKITTSLVKTETQASTSANVQEPKTSKAPTIVSIEDFLSSAEKQPPTAVAPKIKVEKVKSATITSSGSASSTSAIATSGRASVSSTATVTVEQVKPKKEAIKSNGHLK